MNTERDQVDVREGIFETEKKRFLFIYVVRKRICKKSSRNRDEVRT